MLNINEPLYLPKGSVRAIIALTITLSTVMSIFTTETIFKALLPLTALIIGYYFGRRTR